MRAELCRRSEGSTNWAGCQSPWSWLGLEGGFSPQAPGAGSLLDEGQHCSLDKT